MGWIMPTAETVNTPPPRRLPAVVWATGWVSFFTDMSTELIYGVLPAFYSATLHLNVVWQGLIEGAAETIVAITKVLSGHWSDRTGGRKWWMVVGYSLSAVFKPLLTFAPLLTSAGGAAALGMRGMDRLGKGIRGAPRDALVSVHVHPAQRGRAFGVQRALDHAGALAGGLIAAAALYRGWVEVEDLFWWALLPAAIGVLIILLFVHDKPKDAAPAKEQTPALSLGQAWRVQPAAMKRFAAVMGVFSLGNSTDMLLLKLAHDQFIAAGMAETTATAALPLLWAWLHVVKSLATPWGGRLSDRIGRGPALRAGWLVYAAVYVGFALAGGGIAPWVLFGVYGLYYGLAEAPERALVSDLSPDPQRRGMAYGLLHAVVGLTALPASLLCGGLWLLFGAPAAFITGGALALLAALLLPWALGTGLAGGNTRS